MARKKRKKQCVSHKSGPETKNIVRQSSCHYENCLSDIKRLNRHQDSFPLKKKSTLEIDQQVFDNNTEWEVEKILSFRKTGKNQNMYLIKWKGWSHKYNSFEPIENLTNCNYLLMKFFEKEAPGPMEIKQMKRIVRNSILCKKKYKSLLKTWNSESIRKFAKKMPINELFQENIISFKKYIKREFKFIIRCLIGMKDDRDKGMLLRAQLYYVCLSIISQREMQLKGLLQKEKYINSLESAPIKIENTVDLERFPIFKYVVETVHGENVIVPTDPPLGCNCSKKCSSKSNCCARMAGCILVYNENRRLKTTEKIPIYECNKKCKCSKDCVNRVVQHGRRIPLCIFKTEYCGWGVKTLEDIPKGVFVCEYIGELIPEYEARIRDVVCFKENVSYLFDLDFNTDSGPNMYSIDTMHFGNVSRFINHSCDPCLVVYPVWIDCLEPNLPRLAFFSKREIKKGQEITFDYENIPENEEFIEVEEDSKNRRMRMMAQVKCQCKAANCREWVFGNA